MASSATAMASSAEGTGKALPKPVLVDDPGATGSRVLSGKDLRIAIVATRWYGKEIVNPLAMACSKELQDKGVTHDNLICLQVSGAFELPFAAMRLIQAEGDKLDAVVCIGCMVKGRTMAYEFISEAVTMGIMKLNIKTDTPVIFGVLTVESEDDAKACAEARGSCGGSSRKCSHGVEWAQSALEMARLKHCTAPKIAEKCKCQCHCETKGCRCACHCSKCDCGTCTCSDCKCTSCKGSGKASSESKTSKMCTQCGDETDKCRCKDCKCTNCCAKSTTAPEAKEEGAKEQTCSACGSTAGQCECSGCECAGCARAKAAKGGVQTAEKECGACCNK